MIPVELDEDGCPIPLYCYRHDPLIAGEDKEQTLCHCWDHLEIAVFGEAAP